MNPLEQIAIDQAIGQELLEVLPKNWTGALLTARFIPGSGTSWSLRITIEARPTASGAALVSETLERRLAELFTAHRKAATGMVEARYIVDAANRAAPSVISEFGYDDN